MRFYKMKTGVYTITNLVNGKIYVGSTIRDFQVRKRDHDRKLKKNIHPNKHLQSAFNKYGINNFKFEILEECEKQFCLSTEQHWINMLYSCNKKHGYNKLSIVINNPGFNQKEEVKLKMKEIAKNRIVSEELKFKRSRPIYQYDINGNLINEFKSVKEAIEKTGINHSCINRALYSKTKSKKYFFKFKFDDRKDHYKTI